MDSEDVDKEVAAVVTVVSNDSGLLSCCYPLSGEPVHPRVSFSWKNLVVRSESLRWDHSRGVGQVPHSRSRQQADLG